MCRAVPVLDLLSTSFWGQSVNVQRLWTLMLTPKGQDKTNRIKQTRPLKPSHPFQHSYHRALHLISQETDGKWVTQAEAVVTNTQ